MKSSITTTYLRLLLSITLFTQTGCFSSPPPFSSPQIVADRAIEILEDGNARFTRGESTHPNQSQERVKMVAPKQAPFAIILSCSDSRVPPEVIFDQGIGDLFVVRTAGHVPDDAGIASIEYAVEHLGVRTIVVMGHESCGAVKAAMSTPEGKSAGSPSLDLLVSAIRPSVAHSSLGAPGDPNIRVPVIANVNAVAKDLLQKSEILREFAEQKKLYFARAIYGLENGEVTFWDMGYPEVAHPTNKEHSKAEDHSKTHH